MAEQIQLQAVAEMAARRAGEHVLAQMAGRRTDVNRADKDDVKHKLDVEAQEIATGIIRAAFPDHPILGEETCGDALPPHDYLWVVDPIDGTINFFHGLPWWCCSVAVRFRGRAVAGAVFAPALGRLFTATADGPALCNGIPIHVSGRSDPGLSVFFTGAGGLAKGQVNSVFFEKIARVVQRIRMNGAAALDQCMVAAGAAEGYFEPGIFHWDMAAASLIVERAGGRCAVMREYGGHKLSFLAANDRLFDRFREILEPLVAAIK